MIWKGVEIDNMAMRLKDLDIIKTFKYILYSRLKELSRWMTVLAEVAAFLVRLMNWNILDIYHLKTLNLSQPHLGIFDVRNYFILLIAFLNHGYNPPRRNSAILLYLAYKQALSLYKLRALKVGITLTHKRKENTNRNSDIIGVEPEELIETESSGRLWSSPYSNMGYGVDALNSENQLRRT
ncbi:hypothetical protein U3516DRAFT_738280 [Neocallimastix sp. 'constans']